MNTHRGNMQRIIDDVDKLERKIADLTTKNKSICAKCASMSKRKKLSDVQRTLRDKLLVQKIENESKLVELRSLVKKTRNKHLSDFTSLEKMRNDVDQAQARYDDKVKWFKQSVGLDERAVENLMIGIYNKYQDEILEHDNNKR
jgi:predicted  nucleic acid-binding Zn-ribbon protein